MLNKSFPELQTKRLLLRQLKKQDAQSLFNLRSNVQINTFINRNIPRNNQEIKEFIVDRNNDFEADKLVFWAICLQINPTLIGTISLWNFNAEHTVAEIGYELHPNFQNQGLMSEAIAEVCNYAFNELKLKMIEAFTHKENLISQKLIRRLGFVLNADRYDENVKNNLIFEKTNA